MAKKSAKPVERMSISVFDKSYAEALALATEAANINSPRTLARVRTKRVRIIAAVERVTGKSGERIFGAERLHPSTIGWRVKRTFTFVA